MKKYSTPVAENIELAATSVLLASAEEDGPPIDDNVDMGEQASYNTPV